MKHTAKYLFIYLKKTTNNDNKINKNNLTKNKKKID